MTKGVWLAIATVVGVCYAAILHNLLFGVAVGAALAGVLSVRAPASNKAPEGPDGERLSSELLL